MGPRRRCSRRKLTRQQSIQKAMQQELNPKVVLDLKDCAIDDRNNGARGLRAPSMKLFDEGRHNRLKDKRVFAGIEVAPDRRHFHAAGGKTTRFLLGQGLAKDQFQ
eukprot:4619522-Pyramimonas_sp.AAC.1